MAQSLSREQALDYLESHGLLTKPRSEYTTPYAKRLASKFIRAGEAGKATNRAAARGKAGAEHLVPNYQQGPLPADVKRDRFSEQYRIGGPETVSDLKGLKLSVDRRRAARGLPKATYYTLIVHGKSRYKHPKNPIGVYTDQTLALHISPKDLTFALKQYPSMPILQFINDLWQPLRHEDEWEEIYSISMKVGNQ